MKKFIPRFFHSYSARSSIPLVLGKGLINSEDYGCNLRFLLFPQISKHFDSIASIDRFTNERIFEFGNGKNSGKNTSPMGDGGGRLAGLVGALMEGRIRIGSPPRVRGRWRQIRDTTVRRGVVPLLHGPRPHRPHPHAPSPLVVAVRRILENRQAKRQLSNRR